MVQMWVGVNMQSASYKLGRFLLGRLKHNSSFVKSTLNFVKEKRVTMAVFTVIGAVKKAKLACYDHVKHEYQQIKLDKPLEIASCFGNLSLKDGKPFVHVHAVLSDAAGKTYAGHLINATVFAAELHLQELRGNKLEREYDQTTGLALWEFGERQGKSAKTVRSSRKVGQSRSWLDRA
ncbi:MAG: DUF296 domain-containing protein [Hadesarchaea archaeon]|nr:MAG: DUF296 domain-containing protein [Hadesarchaea archaeon]